MKNEGTDPTALLRGNLRPFMAAVNGMRVEAFHIFVILSEFRKMRNESKRLIDPSVAIVSLAPFRRTRLK